MTATLDLSRFDLVALLDGCVENLRAVYDEHAALFPYATLLVDGRFVSDYDHPHALRYTINTLLGLAEAARSGAGGVGEDEVVGMIGAFLERRSDQIETCADLGLLLLLLTEYGDPGSRAVDGVVERLVNTLRGRAHRRLNIQDLAWTIWGSCSATRHNVPKAERLARTAFDLVCSRYLDSRSGLPNHSRQRYRRGIVSFGGLVYFMRAAHEYANAFNDTFAESLFVHGVEQTMNLQGPRGEWPWMIGVHSGKPLDAYPVFSVHQDSMAMLFLLPAYDRLVSGTKRAIERSLAWGFGANELSTSFYLSNPFHAYRSIERAEKAPRVRRYFRSRATALGGRPAAFESTSARLNTQCRSYHLGWILYAWASRPEAIAAQRPQG